MADDGSEIIGGVGVSITGDYSALQTAFADAQSKAQQAGEDIADSFNTGVAGVSDAGDIVTGALDDVSGASQQASGAITQVGESSDEATGKLAEMAGQLTAIGEALAITEGLKEFGTQALEAADSVTTASIALTKLTGSAEGAQQTIEGLDVLGLSDGLSMPSLLTASTRMTAMLPPGTDVVGLLSEIANGAAVMGTNISQAATRFDQMADSGTTSARSLQSLGLSLPTLANALNQVAGTTVATSDNVAAMFKAMDDQGRIAVLSAALANLGGTAQQAANATFGGQWNQLAAAWDQTLVKVGEALLPVISELTDFLKLDVVPVVSAIASAFNELSGPVQQFVVTAGLLVAAAVPLTGALAAGGLALAGLNAIVPAGTALLQSLGLVAKDTSVAQATVAVTAGEATVAEGGLATQAATTAGALDGEAVSANATAAAQSKLSFGSVATTAGYIGLAIASINVFDAELKLNSAMNAVSSSQNTLNDQNQKLIQSLANMGISTASLVSGFNQAVQSGESYGQASDQLNAKARDLIATYVQQHQAQYQLQQDNILINGAIQSTIATAGEQTQAYRTALGVYNAMSAAMQSGDAIYKGQKVNNQDLADALGKVASAAAAVPGTILPVNVALAESNLAALKAVTAYQQAHDVYEALLAAYNNGAPVLGQLNEAYAKQTQAEQAAAAAGAPVADSLQAITIASNNAVNVTTLLASAHGIAADQATAQKDSLQVLDAAILIDSQKLDLLVTAQNDLQKAVQAGTAQNSEFIAKQQEVSAASQKLTDDTFKLQAAQLAQGNEAAAAGGQEGVLKAALDEADLSLDQARTKFDTGAISATAYASAVKAVVTAGVNLAVQAAEDAADIGRSTDAASLAAAAAAGAAAKVAALTQAFKDNKAAASDVASAQTSALTAAIALAQQQAILATGLQGATDAVSIQTVAVAEAQAKYDALVAAWQSGKPVFDQLQSAQSDLTTKQDALNSSIAAGTPLVETFTGATSLMASAEYGSVSAADAAAAGIGAVGTAAQNATAQTDALGDSINSIVSDFANASSDFANLSGKGTAGGTVGGPAGYTASITYEPGTMGGGSEIVTWVPDQATIDTMRVAYEQQLYAQGYTPTGIAQMTTTPLATILTDLGLTAAQAGMTAAGVAAAGSATGSNSGAVLAPAGTTIPTGIFPTTGTGATDTTGGGATTGTAATGTAAPAGSASGAGTSAIDGGSYPAVTAHQATGEIWSVQDVGGSTAAGSVAAAALTQQITTTVNQTSTGASGGLVQSGIAGMVQTLSDVGTGLVVTLGTVAQAVAAVAQTVATAVGIPSSYLQPGSVTSGALPGVYSSNGARSSTTGLITDLFPSTGAGTNVIPNIGYNGATTLPSGSVLNAGTLAWLQQQITAGGGVGNEPSGLVGFYLPANAGVAAPGSTGNAPPVGSYLPAPSYAPGAAPGSTGNTFTVSVNLAGANFSAMSPAEIQQTIAGAVTTQLVTQLRAAGARF